MQHFNSTTHLLNKFHNPHTYAHSTLQRKPNLGAPFIDGTPLLSFYETMILPILDYNRKYTELATAANKQKLLYFHHSYGYVTHTQADETRTCTPYTEKTHSGINTICTTPSEPTCKQECTSKERRSSLELNLKVHYAKMETLRCTLIYKTFFSWNNPADDIKMIGRRTLF